MKIKICIKILFVYFFSIAQLISDEIDMKIKDINNSVVHNDSDYLWMTEDVRKEVIKRLLLLIESGDANQAQIAEEKLVKIGHKETIEKLTNDLYNSHKKNTLEYGATVESIPYLMKGVYQGSALPVERVSDTAMPSVRNRFAYAVLYAISHSASLPWESRQWADKMVRCIIGNSEDESRIDLLKLWWEKNQDAILEKRFEDATWLPRYKGQVSYLGWEEVRERKAEQDQMRENRQLHHAAGKNSISQKSEQSRWQLWAVLPACLILLLIFLRWKICSQFA